MAGAVPVAAVDRWQLATEAYRLNFPSSVTYLSDAEALSPRRVVREAGPIHLLLASPECTHHSVARGNRPRSDASRDSAFEVIRFAKALEPRWVIVENVLQMRSWNRFAEWLAKLQQLGYHTAAGVLDAQYFGTPQSRRRLFVVADREAPPKLPEQRQQTRRTVASLLGQGQCKNRPWAFSPLDVGTRAKATLARAQRAALELGAGQPFVMVYYGTDGAGGFQSLGRPLRTVTTLDRFAYVRKNGHGLEMRMLQPPELAAAMGFSRTHRWPDSTRRESIKLIGNAVCPRVMRAVVAGLIGRHGRSKVVRTRAR